MSLHGQNFFGGESDFIKGDLKDTIGAGGMNQFLRDLLSTGKKDIARKAGRSRESIRESGASTGFRGANVNAFNDLFAEETSQIGQLNVGVGGLAESNRANAVGQLIGVNQFEGGQQFNKAQMEEAVRQYEKTFQENKRQFGLDYALRQRELDLLEQAQSGSFGSIIGDVLGFGAGIATGGAFGGIASGVGDIFSGFFKKDE